MNKKIEKNTLHIPKQQVGKFTLSSQFVTWNRDKKGLETALSKEDLHRFLQLHEEVEKKPSSHLKELEALHQKYPNVSEIANLLTFTYIKTRKIKKAERLIKQVYMRSPDCLFAKINYGDQCLRKGKWKSIPEIFDGKCDLKELYPEKSTFHVTEFRGFMNLMGHYFLLKNERDIAECYHYLSQVVDPKHPSTKHLAYKLNKKNFLQRFFFWKKLYSKTTRIDYGKHKSAH